MLTFTESRIRGISGREENHTRPEYWKNDYGLFEIRDVYKGSSDVYTGWYIVASFRTEEEMKSWAESFYASYPFCYPKDSGLEGPKAHPEPKWIGQGDRTKILKNLARSFIPGSPGRTFNPEFRTEGYGVGDDAGECKVYDVVKDGKEVGCYHVSTHPNFEAAKAWAMTHFGITKGGSKATRYVAPLPPLKDSERKLLLLS